MCRLVTPGQSKLYYDCISPDLHAAARQLQAFVTHAPSPPWKHLASRISSGSQKQAGTSREIASLEPSLTASADIYAKFIDLEWQQRNRLLAGAQSAMKTGQPSQWSRLTGETVAARNRYMNVEPFAGNRVKLDVGEGVSDYINASPIQLGKRRYIATQGPKNTNLNHFYRMLNAEVRGTAVVVMLTQTHESGREKCFQYYPLSPEESPLEIPIDPESGDGFHGIVELVNTEDDHATRTQIRHLRLRTETEEETEDSTQSPQEKDIYHLLFSGWPDFLVPEGENRAALTRLIQLSAKFNSAPSTTPAAASAQINGNATSDFAKSEQDNPRIVHCSAGVGRSGTFIALDYLLSLLYTGQLDNIPADKDPIMDTVDLLRQQRMMMVQSEAQYYFVYEALKEAFLARANPSNGDTNAGAEKTA